MTVRLIMQDESTGAELNWTMSDADAAYVRNFMETKHGVPVHTQIASITRQEVDGNSFKIEYSIGE